MSLIDHLDVLSDHQTIPGKSYSQYSRMMTAPTDWGANGMKRHIKIVAHGANTLGAITFKLLGYNQPDMTDAIIIDQTKSYEQADVKKGSVFWLDIQQTGERFKYIALLYDVVGGVEDTDARDDLQYCPIEPMLNNPEEKENTYSAYIVLDRTDNVPFEVNNQDKVFL